MLLCTFFADKKTERQGRMRSQIRFAVVTCEVRLVRISKGAEPIDEVGDRTEIGVHDNMRICSYSILKLLIEV